MAIWAWILLGVYGGISAVLFAIGWWIGSLATHPETGSSLTWSECAWAFGSALFVAAFWPLILVVNVLKVPQ